MSLDRSLRTAGSLTRHRNVLTRAERLDKLTEAGKWDDKKAVFGLVKVGNRKMAVIGKPAKAAEGHAAAPAAGAAAPAAGAKGAAPAAAGAKPAAGAGKPAAGAAKPAGKK